MNVLTVANDRDKAHVGGDAMRWLTAEAEAGCKYCQYFYSRCLLLGILGPKDPAYMLKLARLSAEQGYVPAQVLVSRVGGYMAMLTKPVFTD